jgi:hypothetical protein
MSKVARLASGQITTFRVRKNSRRLLIVVQLVPLLRDESALVIRNDPKQCRLCQGAPSRPGRVYVSAVTVRYHSAMMASISIFAWWCWRTGP